MNSRTTKLKFYFQRHQAKCRNIPFLLTLEQWWRIWQDSGKWDQRGRHKGQYVMARYGDKGAYEIGNVKICLVEENNKESRRVSGEAHHFYGKNAWLEMPLKSRATHRAKLQAQPKTPEHIANTAASLRRYYSSDEARAKASAAAKKRYSSIEVRAQASEARLELYRRTVREDFLNGGPYG